MLHSQVRQHRRYDSATGLTPAHNMAYTTRKPGEHGTKRALCAHTLCGECTVGVRVVSSHISA